MPHSSTATTELRVNFMSAGLNGIQQHRHGFHVAPIDPCAGKVIGLAPCERGAIDLPALLPPGCNQGGQ